MNIKNVVFEKIKKVLGKTSDCSMIIDALLNVKGKGEDCEVEFNRRYSMQLEIFNHCILANMLKSWNLDESINNLEVVFVAVNQVFVNCTNLI